MADKIAPRTDGVEPVPLEMEEPIKEPIEKVQRGVQLAEAVTLSWTKRSLIVMYIWWVEEPKQAEGFLLILGKHVAFVLFERSSEQSHVKSLSLHHQ